MDLPMVLLNEMSNEFQETETAKLGLEYLREYDNSKRPLVKQDDELDQDEEGEDDDGEDEDEYDSEPLEEGFWYVIDQWFYSVFFIGIFGIFVYVEMPLDILAMLLHPMNKPCEAGDTEDEFGDPDLI